MGQLLKNPELLPVTKALAARQRKSVEAYLRIGNCGMVYLDQRRNRYYYDHLTSDGKYVIVSRYVENPGEIDVYLDREFPTRQECQDMLAALMGMESKMGVKRQPELAGKWR